MAKHLVSWRDGHEILCKFIFIQISAKISQNKSKTVNFNGFFLSEYILDTDVVLDHLPTSSYAKFVRSYEHPEALIALYGLTNSFYKKAGLYSEGFQQCKQYRINQSLIPRLGGIQQCHS